MSDKTLSQRLSEYFKDHFWTANREKAREIMAIAQAEAQEAQAIGEQTPVAKGEMWHPDPWLIGNVEAWKKEPPTQVGEDDDERRKQSRAELAKVMAANGWDIYGGSDYPWVVAMNYAWQEGWLDAFARSPMSSEAREKAVEALKAAHREAQESRKHFSPSDLDRIHIESLVVQLSEALSALRG